MKLKFKIPPPKQLKKTTLRRFLFKRTIYYILPNVLFNFLVAYASFRELGYTHFFSGEQNLARLTLPMAIFLPVILTIDIIKRVTDAAEQEAIEFQVDQQLNIKRLMTRLSITHGIMTGALVLSLLCLAQYQWSKEYQLNATTMAIVVGILAGILTVVFVYLPVWRLRPWMCKRIRIVTDIDEE